VTLGGEHGRECRGDILARDETNAAVPAIVGERAGRQRAAEHDRHQVHVEVVAQEGVRQAAVEDQLLGEKVSGEAANFACAAGLITLV
jgi:hypothetical protein